MVVDRTTSHFMIALRTARDGFLDAKTASNSSGGSVTFSVLNTLNGLYAFYRSEERNHLSIFLVGHFFLLGDDRVAARITTDRRRILHSLGTECVSSDCRHRLRSQCEKKKLLRLFDKKWCVAFTILHSFRRFGSLLVNNQFQSNLT